MTFSIAGHCSRTGMAGVAITTSRIAVGSRCPHVRAGAGAVTTQNVTDPSIGPEVLALMASGVAASEAIATVAYGLEGNGILRAGLAPASCDSPSRFRGGQCAFKLIWGDENTARHGFSVLGIIQ